MIRFSKANAKIEALYGVEELQPYLVGKRKVYSLDLLSGWSCPFAEACLSRAVVGADGRRKIRDGAKTQFRCFSASQEVQYNDVYDLRNNNFQALRHLTENEMYDMLSQNLPKDAGIVRIHVAGDFFNRAYMRAWIRVAVANPNTLFYAYTKSLRYWLELQDTMPDNFILTASRGGREDHLISEHNLREARVVFSEIEAYNMGLEIDHTDEHACRPSLRSQSFALLVHGTQPKGSDAAEALKILKRDKVKHSYSKKKANTV